MFYWLNFCSILVLRRPVHGLSAQILLKIGSCTAELIKKCEIPGSLGVNWQKCNGWGRTVSDNQRLVWMLPD